MRGILIDHDVEGHFERISQCLNSPEWAELWASFPLRVFRLHDVSLSTTTTDDIIWNHCQQNGLVLLTGNRNNDGPTSLEATIQREDTDESLPVLTIANPDELIQSDGYAGRVAVRLLETLLDIELYLGCGRLYLP